MTPPPLLPSGAGGGGRNQAVIAPFLRGLEGFQLVHFVELTYSYDSPKYDAIMFGNLIYSDFFKVWWRKSRHRSQHNISRWRDSRQKAQGG